MALFNPIHHPICFTPPLRIAVSSWTRHTPFALYLVDLLRPRTIVELGSHYGVSYCAFCQAVKASGLETRCFAVDTWQGDTQSGIYGPDVLADLQAHHDPLYGNFSRLIQATFDEALAQFEDASIDLLHIDGFHTYEAVRHDFDTWLPKMSERGVIILHDTNERADDFGVWKLFEELQARYPHFEFLHEHGLGLVAVGETYPEPLRELLEAPAQDVPTIRAFFSQIGDEVANTAELEKARVELQDLRAQVEAAKPKPRPSFTNLSLAAWHILTSQGISAATKRIYLWLTGKRGYHLEQSADGSQPPTPAKPPLSTS